MIVRIYQKPNSCFLNQSYYFFQKYTKNDLDLTLSTKRAKNLTEIEKDIIMQLVEHNMKEIYEQSSFGWIKEDKEVEMLEDSAWYLLATDTDGKICGYVHFRYEMVYNDELLQVYEVCIIFPISITYIDTSRPILPHLGQSRHISIHLYPPWPILINLDQSTLY